MMRESFEAIKVGDSVFIAGLEGPQTVTFATPLHFEAAGIFFRKEDGSMLVHCENLRPCMAFHEPVIIIPKPII